MFIVSTDRYGNAQARELERHVPKTFPRRASGQPLYRIVERDDGTADLLTYTRLGGQAVLLGVFGSSRAAELEIRRRVECRLLGDEGEAISVRIAE